MRPTAVEPLDNQGRRLSECLDLGIVDRKTEGREKLQAVVFDLDAVGEVDPDAYGTLLDFNSAAAQAKGALGDKAASLSEIWRQKQLQYT